MRSFTPFTPNSRPPGDIAETGESGCEYRRDNLTPGQKQSLQVGKTIGWGSFACVYEKKGDPGRVVKLTTDPDDANALAVLGEKNLKSLPKVYGTHALLTANGGEQQFYAIDIEKVAPLAAQSDDAGAVGIFNDYLVSKYEPGNFPTKLNASMKRLVKDCMDAQATGYLKDGSRCATVVREAVAVYNDLGKNGYTFEDAHMGNWGRNKEGRLVAIDLGFSTTAPKPKQGLPALAGAKKRRRKMLGAQEEPKQEGGGMLLGLVILGLSILAFTQSKAYEKPEKK